MVRAAGVDYRGLCAGYGCALAGGVRYMWAQLRARIYGVFALQCSGLLDAWVFTVSRLDVPNLPCRITGTEPYLPFSCKRWFGSPKLLAF